MGREETIAMMARNGNAFEDLLVLDLTRYMPGGFATQILADWGATVIKVRPAHQTRHFLLQHCALPKQKIDLFRPEKQRSK